MMAIQGCHKLIFLILMSGTHLESHLFSVLSNDLYPKEKRAFDWNLISPKADSIILLKKKTSLAFSAQTKKLSCFALLS